MQMENTNPFSDPLEGLLQPFENGFYVGQEEAVSRFLASATSNRLHHAWIFSGPNGVGKASFAFRIARAFVERQTMEGPVDADSLAKHSMEDHPVFRRVASGGHPNILHLRIPYDPKKRAYRMLLTVDEVRKTVNFFGATAGAGGWRVAIIDMAEQMTLSASNALLKILEEPPKKTLFFVLTTRAGRLLPTIRSRCQHLTFNPLNDDDLTVAFGKAVRDAPKYLDAIKSHHHRIGGSVRRAYEFVLYDFSALIDEFEALMILGSKAPIRRVHGFADQLCGHDATARYDFFIDLTETYVSRKLRADQTNLMLFRYSEVWDTIEKRFDLEIDFNLDRKQTIMDVINDLVELTE